MKKRILSAVMAIVMSFSALSGCGNKKEDEGEKVVLNYVMPGPGIQQDSEKVWKAWNEKLQEKLPNVEVKFNVLSLSEYQQSFALMLSTNEPIDIANTYMLDFDGEVGRKTFEPLDDLLKEYGQDIIKQLPDWFLNYQKIDGKMYGIPGYQMCGSIPGLMMFKEIADKYLDVEGFTEEFQSHMPISEKSYQYLEEMLINAKKDGHTFKTTPLLWGKGSEEIISGFAIPTDPDAEVKISYSYFTDTAKSNFARRRDWYKKGYIREDSLSATDDNNYIGKLDGMPWWTVTYSPGYEKTLSEKYGHEVIAIPYYTNYYTPSKNSAAGTSILASSKHKKEAMQVINLLQTDKELYNMLVYGLEGEHYKKIGDDRIETPSGAQASSNDNYGLWSWIIGNTELAYDLQTTSEGYKSWVFDEVNKTEWRSKLMGFRPDTTSFATELAQIEAIKEEYEPSINSGALANWEEKYAEWQKKFEIAGGKKIQEELQKQIDEFLAKK